MIPSSVRIFACSVPVDMRKSFDGLALAARELLHEDPESGALFVFTNKRHNRLKVLWFDDNGYCLLYKRVHRALFRVPSPTRSGDAKVQIDGAVLGKIIAGVHPKNVRSRRAA